MSIVQSLSVSGYISSKTRKLVSKPKKGDRVIDSDNVIGTIVDCSNRHSIDVKYDKDSGAGFYCLVKSCILYDPLYYLKGN